MEETLKSDGAERRSLHDFVGPDAPYPVLLSMVSYLDIIDIIRLTRTCRAFSSLYRRLLKSHWNINRRLSRFVNDPVALRRKIAAADGLISGSFALQFLDRQVWPESDLDLYISGDDSSYQELIEQIVAQEGYQRVEKERISTAEEEDAEFYDGEAYNKFQVTELVKHGKVKIQLMRSERPALQVILENFYMTVVMNVISADTAYCIFPSLTAVWKKTLFLRPREPLHDVLVDKYEARGWQLDNYRYPPSEHIKWKVSTSEQPIFRWRQRDEWDLISHQSFNRSYTKVLGDKSTWKIPLDYEASSERATTPFSSRSPFDYASITLFGRLTTDSDSINYNQYGIRHASASPFVSIVLQHKYFIGDDDWMKWLGRKLYPYVKSQLVKLPLDQRPAFYAELFKTDAFMRIHALDWKPPPGVDWEYFDDKIPEWFDDFQAASRMRHNDLSAFMSRLFS